MSVLKKSTALFLSIVIVICSMLMNIGTVLAAERNQSSSVLDDDEINDFSVPELNVTVDDENKWTNDINKLRLLLLSVLKYIIRQVRISLTIGVIIQILMRVCGMGMNRKICLKALII